MKGSHIWVGLEQVIKAMFKLMFTKMTETET